jgi:hypothetical protein
VCFGWDIRLFVLPCFTILQQLLGLEILLRFLFDFGLPWLGFRQAIRRNDANDMNAIHRIAVNWFRATGKVQYARICIDYVYLILNLHPALLSIWSKYRTCSMVGNSGRNVAWDQANEFMNLDLKGMKPGDPNRIDKVLTMLNGLRAAESHLRAAVGQERSEPGEYTPVKPHHVQLTVDALKQRLGATNAEVLQRGTNNNPFGSSAKPWNRVKNPANLPGIPTEHALRMEAVNWVTGQLEKSPFPMDPPRLAHKRPKNGRGKTFTVFEKFYQNKKWPFWARCGCIFLIFFKGSTS